MDVTSSYPLIIPAAGIGTRMGANKAKQYIEINGKTILEHTLTVFLSHPQINQIVVILHPNDEYFCTLPIASDKRIATITGGAERVDSVLSGLQYLQQLDSSEMPNEHVLVHDAARPCIDHASISQLIATCKDHQGGILAIPVADTIKQARACNSVIDKTINREKLWRAQTPQMFKLVELNQAIISSQALGISVTDEASAMEHSNAEIKLVLGKSNNIKITHPSDLALATYYLSNKDKNL